MTRTVRILGTCAVLLAGCTGPPPAPIRDTVAEQRPGESASPAGPATPDAAADGLADEATLARLLPVALERNPRIQAARARWGATVQQITLARSLPDPQLTYGVFLENVETRVGPQRQRVVVMQMVPFPWKLKLAADSAAAGARTEALSYAIAVRDVVVALKDAYFEYWYLHRSRTIARGHMSLLEQLLATARNEQARGAVTLTDLLRLESQKAQLEYDLLTLTELADVERAKLNALSNRDARATLGAPGDLAPPAALAIDLPALIALGHEHRQEIRRARVRLEQAGIDVSRARWAMAPDLTLGGSWIDVGPSIMPNPESGKDASMLTIGVTLPIWPGKNLARIRKAEAMETARREMVIGEERTLEALVEQFTFRLRNARRLVELYGQTLLPQAEQAARLAREWYEGGQGGFMHVIEVQAVLYNYHLALDRARADYHQALNRLEGLVGASLRAVVR